MPELVAANPGVEWTKLQAGQILAIPATWPALGGAPAPAPAPTPPAVDIPPPVGNDYPTPEDYQVPLPEVVDPYGEKPDGAIPPPPFDQLPIPDGGGGFNPAPPVPMPDAPWVPTAAHYARAQAILAAWAAKYPMAASPQDFGRVQGDLSAVWTSRTKTICAYYQKWANASGAVLRTDGLLDKPTYTSLENTFVDLVKATPLPKPTSSSPAPAKSSNGGGLGLLVPLAAAILF